MRISLWLLVLGSIHEARSFCPNVRPLALRAIVRGNDAFALKSSTIATCQPTGASGGQYQEGKEGEQSPSSLSDVNANMDESSYPPLWNELLARFQGDFDNYDQVVKDRQKGLLPRELGGHEHIHCCLVPVATDARLAAFYFDGDPTAIFRFRYYQLVPDVQANTVDTVLHTIDPALEAKLRACSNPLEWKRIFETEKGSDRVTLLQDCDVRWSWQLDPVQHAYAVSHHQKKSENDDDDTGMHAVMVHGEAVVESQVMPGFQILIRDQLSLWNNELWIHDRGFDPKTMKFIYGNQRGVPYRLERVADIKPSKGGDSSDTDNSERDVVNEDLAWTLGPNHRTAEEYKQKIADVGGPSRPKKR